MPVEAVQAGAKGTKAQPFHAAAGSRAVWWLDSQVDIKLTRSQTDGHLGMWTFQARRGAASPMHVHHREDEQFLLVEGQARFIIGEQRLDAGPGDLVFLPREIPHAYLITSETARGIGSVTPGGFEAYFTDLATPVRTGEPEPSPPSIEAMADGAPRYGIEIVGPPPTLE